MAVPTIEPQQISEARRGYLPGPIARVMAMLPLKPLEFAANHILLGVLDRHPGITTRMGEHSAKRFAIDPLDCPFVFILEPRPAQARLQAVTSLAGQSFDARIAGSMVVLTGLLDGTYDGDALFFTRDLVIEGDTAAVLALRNAIEDANLEPSRILGVPEHVAPYVDGGLRSLAGRIRSWLGAPPGAATGDL
jgi:predicted lipid carrier protein YhbT